jgi:hypothetical protein
MSVLTILIFWNMIFIIFMNMQTFAFYTIFSIPINISEFSAPCFTTQVGLQFGIICPNINTNINVNFHTPRDHFIS